MIAVDIDSWYTYYRCNNVEDFNITVQNDFSVVDVYVRLRPGWKYSQFMKIKSFKQELGEMAPTIFCKSGDFNINHMVKIQQFDESLGNKWSAQIFCSSKLIIGKNGEINATGCGFCHDISLLSQQMESLR
eukprot:70919_1